MPLSALRTPQLVEGYATTPTRGYATALAGTPQLVEGAPCLLCPILAAERFAQTTAEGSADAPLTAWTAAFITDRLQPFWTPDAATASQVSEVAALFGRAFGVDPDAPDFLEQWERAMEKEENLIRLLEHEDFWWYAYWYWGGMEGDTMPINLGAAKGKSIWQNE